MAVPGLGHQWHLDPVEDTGGGISIPPTQRTAGVGLIGETMVIAGSWSGNAPNGASLTMGDTNNRKTLPATTVNRGFVGFLRRDATWLEEVSVKINSAYGNPTPHSGTATVAAGETIVASVPPEIFEDALGGICLLYTSPSPRD